MRRVSVWAPNATRVQLAAADAAWAMVQGKRGWWSAQCRPSGNPDYGFIVDGEGPFPDPRSPWQPHGVEGLSRQVDHGRFRWRDRGWQSPALADAVIYELHVGTFTADGTFDAAIEHLDQLCDLGITHVELMPVHQFPGSRGWGYDATSLFAPHAAYGGPAGLKRLVDACHARSLAVILDVVYNHLAPEGNFLPRYGPYLTDRYGTLWGQGINLDGPGSDEVRRFICDNALHWLRDYHLDGLRLDAVHGFIDTSARPLLEQLSSEVATLQGDLGRHLTLIAESNQNDPRIVGAAATGGMGLAAMWNDDFHHALHVTLSGERDGYYLDFKGAADLAVVLERGFLYGGRYSQSRDSSYGRADQDVEGGSLIAYLQNHDQVGNRALGERATQIMTPEAVRVGAALVLCSPFVPLLFQGEEWAASSPFLYFTDLQDPRLGRAVRQGRRREFSEFLPSGTRVPDPQAEATFLRSQLDWSERDEAPHREMLDWYRALIRLRRRRPDLRAGGPAEVAIGRGGSWLRLRRSNVSLAVNLASARRRIPLQDAGSYRLLLASRSGARVEPGAVSLPACSVAITEFQGAGASAAER